MTGELATELAAVRAMLEDHERRLYPIAASELPPPVTDTGSRGMDGPRWAVGKDWEVVALDDTEFQDCVYLSRDVPLARDIESLTLEDARRLAAALLAAISYCTDDLAQRRSGKAQV